MSDRIGAYIIHAQKMFLMDQMYSVKIENTELHNRIDEVENERLKDENERIRCCFNCVNSNNGNHNTCKLSESETGYCIDNNFKNWKRKETI